MKELECRILCLEDLPSDAALAEREIRKVLPGCTIKVVDTEDDFVYQLEIFNPDIVISDYQLPTFDGLSALKIVLEKLPLVPVIILTGSMNEDTAVQCMRAGASDYVIKEHFKRLGPTVLNALEQKEIKARKLEAELAFKKSEEKFRSLFENHAAIKLLIDPDTGKIEEANKAAALFYGYTADELRRMNISEINTLPDESIKNEMLKVENSQSLFFDFLHRLKDGSLRNVEVYSSKVDIGGKDYLHSIIHDVTEKKKAEKALLQSEENFHRSISESPLGIRIVTIDGKTVYANKAFLDIYEFTSLDEFINTPAEKRYTPESYERHLERKELRKNGQDIFDYELSITRKNGEIRQVKVSRKEVQWNGIKHFQVINQDITEQKILTDELIAAKEKAEESDRLKTAFLHNISHEIRTPLNAIVGFSGLLNEPDLIPEKRKKFTETLVKSSDQLLSIIADIVSISTIEAGQEKVSESEVDLNSALKLVYDQFVIKAQKQNVKLSIKHFVPDLYVISDMTKLVQILSNLIANALKFTQEGSINFGYLLKDSELEFYVEDTGIGIPREMHEEIFKRFRQVESSITRKFGGSGLGLSISKAYVELLGGKIWLNSEPDKGSTFFFTIPFKEIHKKPVSEQLDSNRQLAPNKKRIEITKPKTLLIAEDDDFNFLIMEEILSVMDLKIVRAVNGIDAVEKCKSNQNFDLILMDLKMPLMDGYEATKQIRNILPEIPIIAQTAYTSDFDKNKAFASGCNDYITKPINQEFLFDKINKQLSKI